MRSKLVEPAIATAMTTNLASLQDIVLNLERVCNTPLPFAYQVHLRMTLWYVPASTFALPFFRSTGGLFLINRLYLTFLPVSPTFASNPFLTLRLFSFKYISHMVPSPFQQQDSLPSCFLDSLKSDKKCALISSFSVISMFFFFFFFLFSWGNGLLID